MSHTPGPWRTDPETNHESVLGADGKVVADCAIFGTLAAHNDEQCAANARLVSAAPGLLSSLKAILSEISTIKGCSDATQKTIFKARAAIAKAEGKAKPV